MFCKTVVVCLRRLTVKNHIHFPIGIIRRMSSVCRIIIDDAYAVADPSWSSQSKNHSLSIQIFSCGSNWIQQPQSTMLPPITHQRFKNLFFSPAARAAGLRERFAVM